MIEFNKGVLNLTFFLANIMLNIFAWSKLVLLSLQSAGSNVMTYNELGATFQQLLF